jgi:hypothetical protein
VASKSGRRAFGFLPARFAWDRQRYPEEIRGVTVDGLWIHRIPMTSRQFKARATGHITEILLGKYPGALPHMLYTLRDCLNNFNKILTLPAFVLACFSSPRRPS